MILKEWKWSNGEENFKSLRSRPNNLTNTESSVIARQHVIVQSLESDIENKDEIIKETVYDSFMFEPSFSRNDNEMGKIREELDDKISNRELLFQRGTNPFLSSSNYINDIVARDIFLKPKNTTFDKIKQSEE